MEQKVRELMSRVFEVPVELLKGSFVQGDVENWDSLRHLLLIAELESEFNVLYEPEEIAAMTSFDGVVTITQSKLKP